MEKKPDTLRGMRLLVFSMGIVMMLGMVVLVYAIYNKVDSDPCLDTFDITLPEGAIQPMGRHGDEISLLVGEELLVIDQCRGDVLRRIGIERGD